MPVDTQHPDYSRYLPIWQQTRDAVCGSVAIKGERALKYLPRPNSLETGNIADARYEQYKKRANYVGFTGRTKNALVGAAFRKEPIYELPAGLEYLDDDATGDGLSLVQMAKDSLSDILETGRQGFLVDYPQAPDGLSAEESAMLDLKASIIPYRAESIVNWKTTSMRGRNLLSLVVLCESYGISDDVFSHDTEKQYRVLALDDDGYYYQQIYRDGEPYSESMYPRDASGALFDFIPFFISGAKNNDPTIDDAPLSDIADVNLAHYRNSADYEESCFISGQPTLFITTSLSVEEWKEANPNGIALGARAGHNLGSDGSATLVQADPNSLVKEAMRDKENQMVMIGARIIQDRGQNETAEAARIRFSSENSVLGDVVKNLSEAIRVCIGWCGMFMGSEQEAVFELNDDFYDKNIDPQSIMAMIQLYDREAIAMPDLRGALRKSGMIERDDEDIEQDLGQRSPL